MNATTPLEAPRPVKLTVDDFRLLHEAGALAGCSHAELIEGMVVEMSPQQRTHSFAKNELTFRLRLALEGLGTGLSAQSEVTVALDPHSAPEPDIALTSAPRGKGFVPGDSVAIAIEIADTTLRHDLTTKRDLYARCAVPEYWVVDVSGGRLHQFAAPDAGRYTDERIVPVEGSIVSLTLPSLAIDGSGIL